MTCRTESNQTWVHTYNAENRLSVVEKVTGDCTTHGTTTDTWTFTYDGDGVRVKEVYSGTGDSYTKYFFAGGAYEVYDDGSPTPITTRYYSIAGMMVAMKKGTDSLKYFAQDHLSSTSIVMNASGGLLSQNRYMPFGEVRDIAGSLDPIPESTTDFGYTGQRNIADMGLMDYRYRFLSTGLSRFIQPDSIVPNPLDPQSLNRYSYALNNPITYNDPTGHFASNICMDDGYCGIPGDSYFKTVMKKELRTRYNWRLEGRFSLEEVDTIFTAATDIKDYVDELTGGNGLNWMNEYLDNTQIVSFADSDNWFNSTFPPVDEYESRALPGWLPGLSQNTVFLGNGFSAADLVHELGHIWDINTGSPGLVGVVGGVADNLNSYIGGGVGTMVCRFCSGGRVDGLYKPSPYIPGKYRFDKSVQSGYGNSSTGEYLAEAFENLIYNPKNLPATDVKTWLDLVITLSTNSLP